VTRLAALKVLEQLRPADTVTICLPLFLAGGEGDRAFARFYPTIAVDGCDKRCARRGTEMYSGKPAASIVITELVSKRGMDKPEGKRRLNEAGKQAVDETAAAIADLVDELLQKHWNRTEGTMEEISLHVVQHRSRRPVRAVPESRCRTSLSTTDGHTDRIAAHLPTIVRGRATCFSENTGN